MNTRTKKWTTASALVILMLVVLAISWGLPVVLVIHAEWSDSQRRDTGLCKTCGYNLTGNVSGVCPECGTAVEGQVGSVEPDQVTP